MDCRNCKWKGAACKQCKKEQEEMTQQQMSRLSWKVVGASYYKPINRYGR
jgi:hypothetical protein